MEVRGRGLFVVVEIDPGQAAARDVCERLMARGLLSKETHETVVRLAPLLPVDRDSPLSSRSVARSARGDGRHPKGVLRPVADQGARIAG